MFTATVHISGVKNTPKTSVAMYTSKAVVAQPAVVSQCRSISLTHFRTLNTMRMNLRQSTLHTRAGPSSPASLVLTAAWLRHDSLAPLDLLTKGFNCRLTKFYRNYLRHFKYILLINTEQCIKILNNTEVWKFWEGDPIPCGPSKSQYHNLI